MAKSGELAARLNQQLNSDSPVRTRTPEQQHYDVSSLESYKLINLCVILYHYVLFCIIMYCFVSLCTVHPSSTQTYFPRFVCLLILTICNGDLFCVYVLNVGKVVLYFQEMKLNAIITLAKHFIL